jgi:hypothetical protein
VRGIRRRADSALARFKTFVGGLHRFVGLDFSNRAVSVDIETFKASFKVSLTRFIHSINVVWCTRFGNYYKARARLTSDCAEFRIRG